MTTFTDAQNTLQWECDPSHLLGRRYTNETSIIEFTLFDDTETGLLYWSIMNKGDSYAYLFDYYRMIKNCLFETRETPLLPSGKPNENKYSFTDFIVGRYYLSDDRILLDEDKDSSIRIQVEKEDDKLVYYTMDGLVLDHYANHIDYWSHKSEYEYIRKDKVVMDDMTFAAKRVRRVKDGEVICCWSARPSERRNKRDQVNKDVVVEDDESVVVAKRVKRE